MPEDDEYNVVALQEQEGRAVNPEITLIKKSGSNPIMSKRIFLDEQGKVCSDGSQCLMAQGTANALRLKRRRHSLSTSWPAALTRPSCLAL